MPNPLLKTKFHRSSTCEVLGRHGALGLWLAFALFVTAGSSVALPNSNGAPSLMANTPSTESALSGGAASPVEGDRTNGVQPIWETWWFIASAVLILASGVIGGYWLRVRSVEARSRKLEEQVANRTRHLAALNAVAAVTSQSLHLQELLTDALEKTLEVTGLEAGGIYLLKEDGQRLTIRAHMGLDESLVQAIDNLKVGEGFSGRVVQTGEPLIVRNIAADPRLTRLAVREMGFRALVAAPLVARGRVLGTLFLITRRDREFSQHEIELLASTSRQIGMAIENARLFEAEERRAEQFRVIAEVGRRFALTLDINELLRQVAGLIQQTFGYYHVGIGLIERDEVVYRVGAGELWDDPQFEFKPAHLKVGAEGLTGWVAGHGEPLLVQDVSQEPRYVWMQGSRTRSELMMPIIAKSQTIGVLDVQSDHLNAFDDKDMNALQSLANQAGAAIENARLYAAEQRRAEQFRVLTKVSQRITSILDIDELLAQVVRLVQRTFGYYHVEIGLIEGDELVFRIGAGDAWGDPQFSAKPSRLRVGKEGISGWVAATGEALMAPDVNKEPRYIPVEGSQAQSELTVPISVKGKVIGVLDVESDRLNDFNDTDLDLITSLANQTGVAIENARLYEQAWQLAVVEERSRLARDLHDSVTQSLYGITLYSQAAAGHLASGRMDKVAEHLRELQDTSQDALAEMRLLIFELRPPILAEAGLAAALQARLLAVEGRAGLKTEFKSEMKGRLPLAIEEGLYRIAQEALNNCLKHGRARRIVVKVWRDDSRVTLTIADDGVGFDPATARERGGLGLSAMAERAAQLGGRLGVNSKPGEGTQVRVEVCV